MQDAGRKTPSPLQVGGAAFRRWGLSGVALRTWRTLRRGGVGLVRAKVRTYLATLRGNPQILEDGARRSSDVALYTDYFQLDSSFGLARADWDDCQTQIASRQPKTPADPAAPLNLWVALGGGATFRFARADAQRLTLDPASGESGSLAALAAEIDAKDFVLFAAGDDRVAPQAGGALYEALVENPALLLFDLVAFDGDRARPLLLPGLDEVHGLACNYFRGRFVMRGDALAAAVAAGAATPLDAARWLFRARLAGETWPASHQPIPLLYIADPAEQIGDERRALIADRRAPAITAKTTVTVIVCTKDKGHLVRQLVRNLLDRQGDLIGEIVIASNQTTNIYARQTLDDLATDKRVAVLAYDQPFNFSRQCNLGARVSHGELLLFLNDDIVPVAEDWLARLCEALDQPGIGAVGPLLLYPDEKVQHAGIYLSNPAVTGHTLRGARLPDEGYLFMAAAPRQVSALTGACLLMRRTDFDVLNGFDPMLASYLQDVDLCLRLGRSGKRLILDPRAILLHLESASIGETLATQRTRDQRAAEFLHFTKRWDDLSDPFRNPNFDARHEALRALRGRPRKRRKLDAAL